MFAFGCVYEWIATNMDSQQDPVYEERTMTSIICDNKIVAYLE